MKSEFKGKRVITLIETDENKHPVIQKTNIMVFESDLDILYSISAKVIIIK